MKKRSLLLVVLILVSVVLCDTADARWRIFGRRRARTNYTYVNNNVGVEWNGPVAIREDDQAACQREANYMAANNIRGHVFGLIGRFEGCGWGGSRTRRCGTCRPGWNATLTGDATAYSASGEAFRVRSWR